MLQYLTDLGNRSWGGHLIQHDVVTLDVAVDEVVRMHPSQPLGDLQSDARFLCM